MITQQTVDIPKYGRMSKLNVTLLLICKYLSVDILVLNNKSVRQNWNNRTDV